MEKIIGIHHGGGWISRRWDIHRFAVLARKLKTELGVDIILLSEGKKVERRKKV
ncbi:hypothetical protein [Candidatus Endomicrobiellum trichonymphae]|uniref:hypothetical protein n=1 Tax=Endomicrobium trichonymphae TaxID=1408204 RepID=UPI0039B8FFE0